MASADKKDSQYVEHRYICGQSSRLCLYRYVYFNIKWMVPNKDHDYGKKQVQIFFFLIHVYLVYTFN